MTKPAPLSHHSRRKRSPDRRNKRNRSQKSSATQHRRAAQLLAQEIEYIHSPVFEQGDADEIILDDMPPGRKEKLTVDPPPDMPPYLAELYRYPLLTPEQEHHQFRKMNYLKYRAVCLRGELDPDAPSKDLMDEIERLLHEALQVRNDIVNANLRLVVSIAKKVVDSSNSLPELISEGNLPLVRAVEIFDFERGTRFSTYATWAVRNCLYRVSPRNRRRHRRFQTGSETLLGFESDARTSITECERYYQQLRRIVDAGLQRLEPRDRRIVTARFALDGSQRPQKFREIAEELNLSTERVRQLLARSLKRLSGTLEPHVPEKPHTAA